MVILEASKRLLGWSLYSGSVYQISFPEQVITSIEDSGTALTPVTSVAAVAAGCFYFDRQNGTIYLRTSDSANPNGKFLGCTFRLHFSKEGVNAPHDLSTGYEVHWRGLLRETSDFGVEIDNQNQLGNAIEGSGSIDFVNDQSFWSPIYDKYYFENQRAYVYSWSRSMAVTEAKLIYRGRIVSKSYDPQKVSFQLKDVINELRASIGLPLISEVAGVRAADNLLSAYQRRLYGYVYGHVCTPVDQVLDGYPLTGTFSLTQGSATVTASSAALYAELSPGDEIRFGSDEDEYSVKTVDSATQITLSDVYGGTTGSGISAVVIPSHNKRYANREFVISSHALRQPSTTVTEAIGLNMVVVADPTDIMEDDDVTIGSEVVPVQRVSGDIITLTQNLVALPSVGATVRRNAVTNCYINDRKLTYSRDFTIDATTGTLTLDPLAEFNVAPTTRVAGTLTFSNGSRTVTGASTFFKAEFQPGDWVKASNQTTWFEVHSVESDTSMTLKTTASYAAATNGDKRRPLVFGDDGFTLSCDVLGATDDGTSDGTLIKTGPMIALDLLDQVGLSDLCNTASFTDAVDLADRRLGLVIPKKCADQTIPKVRDVINEINQSIFGVLYQDSSFLLAYGVIKPTLPAGDVLTLKEADVLKLAVKSDSSRIVKTVKVNYLKREYDPVAKAATFLQAEKMSNNAAYLAKSLAEKIVETLLVDATDAQIYANRWAYILEVASSVVSIETKMQAALAQINDVVDLQHEKLYERVGSTSKRKIAAVHEARKSMSDSRIELDDLANAFSRVAVITEDDAPSWDDSSEEERFYNSFITDSYGMQGNDPDTAGINEIW